MEGKEDRGKQTLAHKAGRKPTFCLYISGATPKSTQAITKLKPLLEELYKDGYDLRVIDVYQDQLPPGSPRVLPVPTLVREYPPPKLRIGSDFSNPETIRRMLGEVTLEETPGE